MRTFIACAGEWVEVDPAYEEARIALAASGAADDKTIYGWRYILPAGEREPDADGGRWPGE